MIPTAALIAGALTPLLAVGANTALIVCAWRSIPVPLPRPIRWIVVNLCAIALVDGAKAHRCLVRAYMRPRHR